GASPRIGSELEASAGMTVVPIGAERSEQAMGEVEETLAEMAEASAEAAEASAQAAESLARAAEARAMAQARTRAAQARARASQARARAAQTRGTMVPLRRGSPGSPEARGDPPGSFSMKPLPVPPWD